MTVELWSPEYADTSDMDANMIDMESDLTSESRLRMLMNDAPQKMKQHHASAFHYEPKTHTHTQRTVVSSSTRTHRATAIDSEA